ncbi:MAG: hypothetical protein ACI8RZ_002035 [Myxococcota bacterium]|jgi:hypothetical protein
MSIKEKLAARPRYEGEAPSQASLLERRETLRERHHVTLSTVNELVASQQQISQELGGDLAAMQSGGARLDEIQSKESQQGMLASLVRTFNRRRMILERRSVSEELLQRYEHVSRRLRQASAFSDELRLTALKLHEEVEELHDECGRALRNEQLGARRVMELESELRVLEGGESELSNMDRERLMDRLQFVERTESLSVELFHAQALLLRHEVAPARALRDTVMGMYEEMSQFVLAATTRVNASGRKIQALGIAADAPTVINELNESLAELDVAMEATEIYVAQAQELLTRVLPEISRQLKDSTTAHAIELTGDLSNMSRERAANMADKALREAAESEVEDWLEKKTL